MKIKLAFFITASLCLSLYAATTPALAKTRVYIAKDNTDVGNYFLHNYDAQLSVGAPFFTDDSDQSKIVISPIETDTLHQTSKEVLPIIHAGIDRIFSLSGLFLPCLNSAIAFGPHYYFQQITYNGTVYQFGEPTLNNYNYKFRTTINDVLAEVRWQFYLLRDFIKPYVLVGIGPGFLATDHHIIAKAGIPGGEITRTEHHTNVAFDAGIGIDFAINHRFDFGIRYLYLNSDRGRTNKNPTFANSKPVEIRDSNTVSLNLNVNFG